jgi:ABC-type uncharacterized transport system ATPase subunit
VQYGFRVNTGDILVHDTTNQRLTVYRNGEIVKTMKQSSLGISALLKDHFAEEVVTKPAVKPIVKSSNSEEALRVLKLSLPKIKPDLPKTSPIVQKKKDAVKRPPIKIDPEDETI